MLQSLTWQKDANRYRAFTLVEILIVLVILGLLAALLFPAFARAKESARSKTCQSNLRQIGFALEQYANDWRGIYPHNDVYRRASSNLNCSWTNTIRQYVKSTIIFTCPDAPDQYFSPGCPPTQHTTNGDLRFDGGYSINNPEMSNRSFSRTFIRTPSNFLLVVDGGGDYTYITNGMENPMPMFVIDHNDIKMRHNDGANVLFADGHVKWLGREALRNSDMWTLRGHPTPER